MDSLGRDEFSHPSNTLDRFAINKRPRGERNHGDNNDNIILNIALFFDDNREWWGTV